MANSYWEGTVDGSTSTFSVPFAYLNKAHVKAKLNGVETTAFTWLSSSQIQFTVTPAAGTVVRIFRESSPTETLVDFSNGFLPEEDLDTAYLHNFYLSQESTDRADDSIVQDVGAWDAQSKRVKNVATPTDGNDAVNKTYADQLQTNAATTISAARDTAVTAVQTEGDTQVSRVTTEGDAQVAAATDQANAAAASATTATAKATEASTSAAEASQSASDAADDAVVASGAAATVANVAGKNRIINGDMRIDQRNVGAVVTVNSTSNTYGIDRWSGRAEAADGVFSMQRVLDADRYWLKATVTAADAAIGAGQIYFMGQQIEAYNAADLMFGTAAAKPITISFRVKASIAGLYGGSVANSGTTRSYPFTFTVDQANTEEVKSVTVPGDVAGVWLTDHGIGLQLWFALGAGATYKGPAAAWASASYFSAAGALDIIGTLGATFQITEVQVEPGSIATPFERRPYGAELALCQRYFWKSFAQGIAPADGTSQYGGSFQAPTPVNTSIPVANVQLPVVMRSSPTVTRYNPRAGGAAGQWTDTSVDSANAQTTNSSDRSFQLSNNVALAGGGTKAWYIHAAADAEL